MGAFTYVYTVFLSDGPVCIYSQAEAELDVPIKIKRSFIGKKIGFMFHVDILSSWAG